MIRIPIGRDMDNSQPLFLDSESLRTHLHLIGATGSGKSNAILVLLRRLMLRSGTSKSCLFVVDPLGNLSRDLLRFLAHPEFCTDSVRERLLYIEPAREDVVLPFNPLLHTSEGNRYYQTMRAVDICLRAWDAQDVTQRPRLLQWLYKAFCAAAVMGFPISVCRYLLHPGTDEHDQILRLIPGEVGYHWKEILRSRGEATKILESTRNRLDPFFESVNLRRMFGVAQSRFDCERVIRERRIVILNLAKLGRIPTLVAHTIGALALNEFMEAATRLATTQGRFAVDPTYIVLDEFQNYVTPDIEEALPTVRQMGLRMLLAHQSFSQLEREDLDLTQMIWQARSRFIFANNARDADIVADELAKLTFDCMKIKHEQRTVRQLITGYRKEWLKSVSSTDSSSSASSHQRTSSTSDSRTRTDVEDVFGYSSSYGQSNQGGESSGVSDTRGSAQTEGQSQQNVPIHRIFREISGVTFQSFEECYLGWGQRIRQLKIGEAFLQTVNDNHVRKVQMPEFRIPETPELDEAVEGLKERNFASDFFISAAEADKYQEICQRQLLAGMVPSAPYDQNLLVTDQFKTPPGSAPAAFEL
ncbi:MAG: DUF87 domain-containing protein [Planctomycetaceae bacterium]